MELSLLFEDNRTGHKDLVLHFAGETFVCDTYYLALDRGIMPDCEDAGKIQVVLRRLLEQWRLALEGQEEGDTVYLPYDFSDQYTAWLRCVRHGTTVVVCRGWADREGWAITPSEVGAYMTDLTGFRETGPVLEIEREALFAALKDTARKADEAQMKPLTQ